MLSSPSSRPARKFSIVFAVFLAFSLPLGVSFPAAARIHHKHHSAPVDGTPSYSDIVIDAETGRILHATNPDSLRHPASLSKMMTLYVTFEALEAGRLRLDQYLPVSSNAAEQSPSKLGLRPGQRIRVQDAILGLVTESANDAAVVLAEALGGSEAGFGKLMTEQARALGMMHTHFDNPSGLPDPEQITTARDMAMLGHALIYHYAQFYPYFSHDSFVYAGIYHHNHNHLMDRYDGMDGIKTGYIRASGFNLVASAKRGGTRLIGVVFGGRSATSRDNRMAQLLDESFSEARQEKASMRMASETESSDAPQGDIGDAGTAESAEYVALPAKVSVVFAPSSAAHEDEDQNENDTAKESDGQNWGIQIGAYSDASLGRRALTRVVSLLPKYLNHTDPSVQPVMTGGITAWRARLMGLDERTARSVCSWLLQHGQSCMIVEP
jgi:D-alanyl-D-alanine carboxypeptidase